MTQRLIEVISIEKKPLRLLFIADENTSDSLNFFENVHDQHSLDVLTNRYEIYQAVESFQKPNVKAYFNDFDFSLLNSHYDIFAYRISKEKLIVHHSLNSMLEHSLTGTRILLAGEKNEGIKTYVKNLSKQDLTTGSLEKLGNNYYADLTIKPSISINKGRIEAFNTQNYATVRAIESLTLNNKTYKIYSKPGTYGWKKIDQGSVLLCEKFIAEENDNKHSNIQMIDLGCGSGLLSLAAHSLGIQHIVATDNNASAVASTKTTFKENNISGEVIAGNCANNIDQKFDLLLCNPPFHKGFDTNNTLTKHFVCAAKRLLKPSGKAYFVTNSFIGIEKIAEKYFNRIETLENNTRFKVLRFSE